MAVVGIAVIHVTSAIMGEVMHARRQRLIELEERAAQAEAERELLAREAVLRERASIARDLHDVVAHGMSVMVVQAGAAQRLLTTQPERAADALEQIQVTGREALTEMRRMLGVLRNDDERRSAARRSRRSTTSGRWSSGASTPACRPSSRSRGCPPPVPRAPR